ncbi:MAG: flippase-like domain-containing protein [Candidatus Methanoperedens sp.]|nr:flippase-like domain-containing protein [Candidatus Methanoperedens sp.]
MKFGDILFITRLITLAIILLVIDYQQLVLILRSIDTNLVILALLLEFSGFLLWTLKWKFLVDRLKNVKFTILFLGLMGGNVLNTNVLRARTFGGFGRATFLKNVTNDHKHANWYATVAMDQATNNFVFSIPLIFSLLFVFLFLDIPLWLSILVEVIVLVLFLLAFFTYLSKQKIDRSTISGFFYLSLRRIYDFTLFKVIRNRFKSYKIFEELVTTGIAEFAKTCKSIVKDRKFLAKDIGLSILMFTFIYSKAFIIFRSVEYTIALPDLIISLSLILWLSSILPIPGGMGIKELIMIGIYSMVGIPITIAAIVSLIDRAVYLFFVIIIAYLSIVFMRLFHIGESKG